MPEFSTNEQLIIDYLLGDLSEAEAGRVHRDRRPQHAEQDEEPLVAPGADAFGREQLPNG